ncbi:MAG: aminodeoxychorismate/anthranilate synthase component II [Alphaproteobacteria bacterium]|jgi:anthranilate synthase component 2|nr:aminodeoxychorismate/anthranilate synthase component II [Alphaproteobacteria bacterium]
MFLLVDNYDSFTYNLWHFLGELGAEVDVHRNDKISVGDALASKPSGLIISPGPCDPDRAGICLDLIRQAPADLPILGVCLGHQCIGQAFGGTVTRAPEPMHGKMSEMRNKGDGIFAGLPESFSATRYHSLVVDRASLPKELVVTAETDDGLIMGLKHAERPIFGVQFHPESIASRHGYGLLANFLRIAGLGAANQNRIEALEANLRKTAS